MGSYQAHNPIQQHARQERESERTPKLANQPTQKIKSQLFVIALRARLGTHLAYGSLYSMDNHSCSFKMGLNRMN
jgi:hypothetical protein